MGVLAGLEDGISEVVQVYPLEGAGLDVLEVEQVVGQGECAEGQAAVASVSGQCGRGRDASPLRELPGRHDTSRATGAGVHRGSGFGEPVAGDEDFSRHARHRQRYHTRECFLGNIGMPSTAIGATGVVQAFTFQLSRLWAVGFSSGLHLLALWISPLGCRV